MFASSKIFWPFLELQREHAVTCYAQDSMKHYKDDIYTMIMKSELL